MAAGRGVFFLTVVLIKQGGRLVLMTRGSTGQWHQATVGLAGGEPWPPRRPCARRSAPKCMARRPTGPARRGDPISVGSAGHGGRKRRRRHANGGGALFRRRGERGRDSKGEKDGEQRELTVRGWKRPGRPEGGRWRRICRRCPAAGGGDFARFRLGGVALRRCAAQPGVVLACESSRHGGAVHRARWPRKRRHALRRRLGRAHQRAKRRGARG